MNQKSFFAPLILGLSLIGCGGNAPPPAAQSASSTSKAAPPATGVTQGLPHRKMGMNYHIDTIGSSVNPMDLKTIQVPAADLIVRGWAIDEPFKAVAGNVDVAIDGIPYAAHYGTSRKDVAGFFKNPSLENAGFDYTVPASVLTPGNHAFNLRVVANDGKSYIESPAISLIVQ
jgi:hypothetical protein